MGFSITAGAVVSGTGSSFQVPMPARVAGDYIQWVIFSDKPVAWSGSSASTYDLLVDIPGKAQVWQKYAAVPAGSGILHTVTLASAGSYTAFAQILHSDGTTNPNSPDGNLALRQALVVGTDKPTASTTGTLPGSTFTVVTDHTPSSNTTYENLDIRNVVNLGGKTNVTYKNCIFRGDAAAPSGSQALVRAWTSHGRGHSFTDCTFVPQNPHFQLDGLKGYGFSLSRCNISGVVDGISVFNTNAPTGACDVVIEASWIHDQAYWPASIDTNHSDGSHCDGIQWQGCTGLVVRGNLFSGVLDPQYQPGQFGTKHTNSCMMIKPDAGAISGATITDNWFYGGNIGINMNDSSSRSISNLGTFTGNRFDHDQRGQGSGTNDTWTVLKPSSTGGTFTGNVYEDSGVAVRIRTQ